jgi:predicted GIY-YIG superfamily endonuclease
MCTSNLVMPAKAGIQGQSHEPPRHATLRLHHGERPQWNALRRRHELYRAACVGTSLGGFSRVHPVHRLVYVEFHATMPLAIQREKQLKKWNRAWKLRLIEELNPQWCDLYEDLLK